MADSFSLLPDLDIPSVDALIEKGDWIQTEPEQLEGTVGVGSTNPSSAQHAPTRPTQATTQSRTQPPHQTDANNWVMIDKDDPFPRVAANTATNPTALALSTADDIDDVTKLGAGLDFATDDHDLQGDNAFIATHFDDGIAFDDMDTAGDVLAGFGEEADADGGAELGLDDSAFGDAFHAPEGEGAGEEGGA
jgi:hypothetical protein